MVERTQQLTDLRPLGASDGDAVAQFLRLMPEGDLTFLKEPIDEDTVAHWIADRRTHRWIAIGASGEIRAMLSIVPGAMWSAHVGELRLVVGHPYRRQGLGRRLARVGLSAALRLGLRKIIVEVVADKAGDIAMFESIGFQPEALLRDHIRDRLGELHDLVLLSHEVEAGASALEVLGLAADFGLGESN